MPVLSFQAVITHHDGSPTPSRRQTWIKSHDFRGLAVAAAKALATTSAQCDYMVLSEHAGSPDACTWLKAVHGADSVMIGPMGGPRIPGGLCVGRACSLDDLLERTGFGPEAERDGLYTVVVAYTGSLAQAAWPPAREHGEPLSQYRTRCAAAELVRVERARQQGFHAVRYDVAPARWVMADLEHLLGLAYRLLPIREPRWNESGTIRQEKFGALDGERGPTLRYALQVARGDYVAYLRLPVFPVRALAQWLKGKNCEINLCHPVVNMQYARTANLSALP
jgi:hypothetical protein